MRKIDWDILPKKQYKSGKLTTDWLASIGYELNFTYDDIVGKIKIIDYKCKESVLCIEYNSERFNIKTNNFTRCKLGAITKKVTSDFKITIGQVFQDEERHMVIIDRKYTKQNRNEKWYKYKCNKCGWDEGWIREYHLERGVGCSCCYGRTVVEGINDIPTTAPWMVKYFQGGYDEAKLYTKNSAKKITPICPDCKRLKDKKLSITNIYANKSIGCICSDGISYPNKILRYLMYELKNIYGESIEFEFEYYRYFTNGRYFDCWFKYLNSEYFIEMDGNIGHGNGLHSKSDKTDEYYIKIDFEKDSIARENNINMIRIDCKIIDFYFIKNNILNSDLSNIFNLNTVDWNEINKNSYKNIVLESCTMWCEREEYENTRCLAERLKISHSTFINYLKKGKNLGWCDYDARKEAVVGRQKSIVTNSVGVSCFYNGNFIGEFPSIISTSKFINENFNIKMDNRRISEIIRGKRKPINGLDFKKINEKCGIEQFLEK